MEVVYHHLMKTSHSRNQQWAEILSFSVPLAAVLADLEFLPSGPWSPPIAFVSARLDILAVDLLAFEFSAVLAIFSSVDLAVFSRQNSQILTQTLTVSPAY